MKQAESPTMLVRLHTLAKMMKELRMTQGILRPKKKKNKRHLSILILFNKRISFCKKYLLAWLKNTFSKRCHAQIKSSWHILPKFVHMSVSHTVHNKKFTQNLMRQWPWTRSGFSTCEASRDSQWEGEKSWRWQVQGKRGVIQLKS